MLTLNNERFTIPEVLFNPSIAGVPQAGLAEAIQEAITCATDDPAIRELFYANIVVVGGNFKFAGIKERLAGEVREVAPEDAVVRIMEMRKGEEVCDPVVCAWEGAAKICRERPDWVKEKSKTRQEYLEEGRKSTFFG